MKPHHSLPRTSFASILAAAALAAGSAQAATITMTVDNIDWNDSMWGSPAGAPTSGNDYVTAVTGNNIVRISADGTSSTFGGDSLEVISGTRGLMKNVSSTATINGDLIISGGLVDHAPNSQSGGGLTGTLDVTNLVINGTGSELEGSIYTDRFTIDGTLTGAGSLLLSGNRTNSEMFFTGISNYTGALTVGSSTGLFTVGFGVDYTFSNTFTLGSNTALELASGQTLTFGSGDLIAGVTTIADGTYSGAALDALGANFVNSGGTLVVGAIPEPSTALLGSLGALLLLRRRRAKG